MFEKNSVTEEFCLEIAKISNAEVKFSEAERIVAATDNSIYQIVPQAIIFPKTTDDIALILKVSNQEKYQKINFCARGGATGTNGQSLSEGVIIDCSKYLNKILEVNIEEGWVEVEPGVVLDQLNNILKPYGYFFAPNLSPSDKATIGGMIATDASGKGSFIYGKTSDHLIAVDTILASGDLYSFGVQNLDEVEDERASKILQLIKEHQAEITKRYPDNKRFPTGYNLSKLVSEKELNLNYLLAGSEGTLGIIKKARLKITKLPQEKLLVVMHYKSFEDALRDTRAIALANPHAIETMDELLLDLAKNNPLYRELEGFISGGERYETKVINIIELAENSKGELDKALDGLTKIIAKESCTLGYKRVANIPDAKIWELRKIAVGILGSKSGSRKPVPFIEDTAVPPDNLEEYVQDLKKLLDSYDLEYAIYGHIDVGCLHVRPALDLTRKEDKDLLATIAKQLLPIVTKHKGVMWAEHGLGNRAGLNSEYFGNKIYELFRQIKEIFDAEYRLNPGKIVAGKKSDLVSLDGNLQADLNKNISTADTNNFISSMACNGNAKCLSINSNQVMCPSEKASRDKTLSPKGRANLIRNWLIFKAKNPVPSNLFSRLSYKRKNKKFFGDIFYSLNKCLSCKGCSNSCPVKVDIPTSKSLFLEWYHNLYPRKIRDYLVANIEGILSYGSKFPRIINGLSNVSRVTNLVNIPALSAINIEKEMMQLGVSFFNEEEFCKLDKKIQQESVFIMQDAFTSFLETELLISAVKLIKKLGFNPIILPYFSSGKPLSVLGFNKKFSVVAQRNIKLLNYYSKFLAPIVSLDAATNLMFREEYKSVKQQQDFEIFLFAEWLQDNLPSKKVKKSGEAFYLLEHCMEKTSTINNSAIWQDIFRNFGLTLNILQAGCCGMSGMFGHLKENTQLAEDIYQLSWEKHFKDNDKSKILSTGFSCRSQVQIRERHIIKHPLMVLEDVI